MPNQPQMRMPHRIYLNEIEYMISEIEYTIEIKYDSSILDCNSLHPPSAVLVC